MQRYVKWLLVMTMATLLSPAAVWAAEGAVHGSFEAGVATVDISDDASRVNEYSTTLPDDDTSAYGKVNLEAESEKLSLGLEGEFYDSDSQSYELEADVARRVMIKSSYGEFTHKLDHDRLDYLNAGVPSGATAASTLNGLGYARTTATGLDAGGGSVNIGSFWAVPNFDWLDANNVTGYIGLGASGQLYAFNPSLPYYNTSMINNAPEAIAWQQIGRASLLGEDFTPSQDFFVVRKEFENEADLKILPNVTIHAGHRLETREGIEQSIGMSKCTSCHITGQARTVDEETEDLKLGATGKFGLLTVDYEFIDRQFENKADDPTRIYDPALSPNPNTQYTPGNSTFDNRLLYDYEVGAIPYDSTPESEKQSHVVKARVDLPGDASVVGSYVKADVESNKYDSAGIALNQSKLTTTYDAYGLKASAKLMKGLTLKLHAKVEEIESDPFSYTLTPMNTTSTASLGGVPDPSFYTDKMRHAAADGETTTVGMDIIYRLARKTTLRLGYDFESLDREEEELGSTDTHTVDASLKTRFGKDISARLAYTFQKIDDPLHNPDASLYVDPYTGLTYFDKDQEPNGAGTIDAVWQPGYLIGNGPTYGTDYYDLRQADMTNLPESVHEAKFSATWSPSVQFSSTLAVRGRFEENELEKSTWEEQTFSPSLSFWYAPTHKLNLTLLYNYLGQRAESKFCQGWYDG